MSEPIEVEKLPIPVQVQFMHDDGTIITMEGPVAYRAGDAVLTGIRGERWPVGRGRFMTTYQPLAPTVLGQDGQYIKKAATALARCMDETFEVQVGYASNKLQGKAGDWLLQYADGSQGVVGADIFKLTYRLLPPSKA